MASRLIEMPTVERRGKRRFTLKADDADVVYRLAARRRITQYQRAKLVNVSSSGMLLELPREKMVPLNRYIEISWSWPYLLDQRIPLKFVTRGLVVRVDAEFVAVHFRTYEFRTAPTKGAA